MNENQRFIPSTNGGVNMSMDQSVPSQNQQGQVLNQVNATMANPTEQVVNVPPANGGMNQANSETPINNMNIDGAYNRMNVAPDYVNEAQVKENIENAKKNTVPVSKELKTVIIIAAILFIFILVMPFLFDLISNIRFH